MSKKKKTAASLAAPSAYGSYGYSLVNGQECYGRFEYDAETSSWQFIKYGNYIAVTDVVKDIDSGDTCVEISFDDMTGQRGSILVSRKVLANPRELQGLLLSKGADVIGPNIHTLLPCLSKSESLIQSTGLTYRTTGWLVDDENADGEGPALAFKGRVLIEGVSGSSPIQYSGTYDLTKKGSFEQWKGVVVDHVIGHIPLEVAVLIGLSPILSSLLGSKNLIYHFWGESSKGKTTAAVLCVSVAGCPDPIKTSTRRNMRDEPLRPLLSSWHGTTNALLGKLRGLDGTIMVFDELSKLSDPKDLSNVVYSISDGADKDRMDSPSSMQAVCSVKTNILSVGEESLIEKTNSGNTGLRMRVCEIQTAFTEDAGHAEAIVQGCCANYGHAAYRFVAYIIQKMGYDQVKAVYTRHLDEYEAALVATGIKAESYRRLAEFGAVILAAAEISEKALGIQFSREETKNFLLEQQTSSLQSYDIGLRAHADLWGYVNQYAANFTVGNDTKWKKAIPCYGRIEPCKSGAGKEVSFSRTSFGGIMKQLGYSNPAIILEKLKKHGLLEHEKGKNYRKRVITSDVGTIPVYTVVFPDA